MEEEILKKYFQDKMKQIDIAKELNVSKYKVSRVVTKDAKYKEEKERRKLLSKQKHREKTINYINKERIKNRDEGYQQLQQSHIQASKELSGRKTMNNQAFRKWNSSIYQYNKKTNAYHLKKGIVTGVDVPKKIKM